MNKFNRYAILILLLSISGAFFYFHLYEYLSVETLRHYQVRAQEWTATHYLSAVGLYNLLYIVMVACAIPCATILTLLGGFLFGGIAVFYAVFSTTLGGMILFLAVRTAVGSRLAQKSSGWIKRMEKGFQRNAFNYLLMLRLIPILPCWVSNVTAGVLNIPLKTFLGATLLGIFPATLIFALAGRGLDKLLMDKNTPFINLLLTPSVLLPLIGLAILSIIPVIYKSWKSREQNPE